MAGTEGDGIIDGDNPEVLRQSSVAPDRQGREGLHRRRSGGSRSGTRQGLPLSRRCRQTCHVSAPGVRYLIAASQGGAGRAPAASWQVGRCERLAVALCPEGPADGPQRLEVRGSSPQACALAAGRAAGGGASSLEGAAVRESSTRATSKQGTAPTPYLAACASWASGTVFTRVSPALSTQPNTTPSISAASWASAARAWAARSARGYVMAMLMSAPAGAPVVGRGSLVRASRNWLPGEALPWSPLIG